MTTTYENLFYEAFQCLPEQAKPLEEYSKDELIRFITILKRAIDTPNIVTSSKPEPIADVENENYGLGIVAATPEDLQSFQEFCSRNFLPVSAENCYVSSICQQHMIDHYSSTGINHRRTEYAMFVILSNVHCSELAPLTCPKEFSLNDRSYAYQLHILVQNADESYDALLTRIRCQLLGEIFTVDRDDHESIPSLPAPKQPQFVSISPHTQIACWPLPRRRDLNRFRADLGVTHILTLLNGKELKNSNICKLIESAGIQSLHIPIEGAELPIFTSSQATLDVLIEHIPVVRNLLLNSTESAPVKMIIHCAAGLHRTGTITYLLLRLCHFSVEQALLIINRTRAITARQVGQKRIDAAENNLLKNIPQ